MNRLLKLNQLWQLIIALAHELTREPGVLFWGILFPILMALGLGLAFTRKQEPVRKVAVIMPDNPHDEAGSELYNFLELECIKNEPDKNQDFNWLYEYDEGKLGKTRFLFYQYNWDTALKNLKRGSISLILTSNDGATVYHFDPLNSDAELTYRKLSTVIGREPGRQAYNNEEIRPLTIKGTRYIDFLIPGLMTMGVMMSTMWGISYGIIEKRSKKLLRRLIATPMRRSHFLVAQVTVRLLMNFIEAAVLILFALLVFGMEIQGSVYALLVLFLAGNMAFAGLAVLVSSNTSNTEVGNGLINAVVTPMMVLSGIFFSYQNFPDWSIGLIKILPLTILTDGMRNIFNEGAGFNEVTLPIFVLVAMGVMFFGIGLKIFKWH